MILLTRPREAAERTAARLRAGGYEVLVEPLLNLDYAPPPRLLGERSPDAVVITSSNGARAVAAHPDLGRLAALPVWTVGSRTTEAVRALGFARIAGEAPDVASLGRRLADEPPADLLYLAAEVRSGEIAAFAPAQRVDVRVVYSARPALKFSEEALVALDAGAVAAALHYSRRLAETFVDLARSAKVLGTALPLAHLCLSEQVAEPLRIAGAPNVVVASEPREDALLACLAKPGGGR